MRKDTLSTKEIADRLRIPVKTIRHWLKRLREEGDIRFAPEGGAPQSNLTRYQAITRQYGAPASTLFDTDDQDGV